MNWPIFLFCSFLCIFFAGGPIEITYNRVDSLRKEMRGRFYYADLVLRTAIRVFVAILKWIIFVLFPTFLIRML